MLEEPRDGPLNDPAVHAQATAVFRSTPGQKRDNAAPTQLAAVRLRIIGPVSLHRIWPLAGSSHLACDRRDGIDQWQQLRDVVAIGPGDLDGQGNAAGSSG